MTNLKGTYYSPDGGGDGIDPDLLSHPLGAGVKTPDSGTSTDATYFSGGKTSPAASAPSSPGEGSTPGTRPLTSTEADLMDEGMSGADIRATDTSSGPPADTTFAARANAGQ